MTNRRTLLKSASAAVALSLATPALAQSDRPIPVVATFSILGDMVARIGGEHVAITTLVGPNGDAHVYQPTPQAARAVSEAEILVVNGLQFEGWLDRLIEASDFDGRRVVATAGIEPIAFGEDAEADGHDHGGEKDHGHDHERDHSHDHGHEDHAGHDTHDHGDDHAHGHEDHAEHDHGHDHGHEDHAGHGHDHHGHNHGAFDPHAWQSLGNAVTYVDDITGALARADPENAAAFHANRADYVAEIEALDAEIREIVSGLPAERRTVVTSHDAFQYFGRQYGLTFLAPQGLSTESEASAQDVARLIEQMRADGISAVFLENVADSRILERIADETGATMGGTLYPGALSGPDGPAPTYLDMMRHNATTLAQALGGA